MFHRVLISNFYSIRDTVELNFRVPGTTPWNSCFRTSESRPEVVLPTVIALYGPNGSGKTTILRALGNAVKFAADSSPFLTEAEFHKMFHPFLSEDRATAPTRIELDFDASLTFPESSVSQAQYCRYTLVVERGEYNESGHVHYEAIHIFPKGRPKRLLERVNNEPVYLARELSIHSTEVDSISLPNNVSAISCFGSNGVDCFPGLVDQLNKVQTNIPGVEPVQLNTKKLAELYLNCPRLFDNCSDILARFNMGIEQLIKEEAVGEKSLVFQHKGIDRWMPMESESAGTLQIMTIYPQIENALDSGNIAIIDTLDRDLHTEQNLEILTWFRQKESNQNKAQLICTLHDPSVLSEFEKEEFFIVEKRLRGATTCYCAGDIQGLRRDGNLGKQYRSGALGGVPVLG